jgi:hypothetical protein
MRSGNGSRLSMLAIGLLVLSMSFGCAMSHIPKAEPVDTGTVPQIQGKGVISIVNVQSDKSVRELGRAGYGKLQGDLFTWTDAAVQLLGTEMQKAGLSVQANGEKSIKIAVLDVKLGVSGIDFVAALAKGNVTIKVETGDGYTKEYTGEKNAIQPPNACEKALTEAVVNMLKDGKIVEYLGK